MNMKALTISQPFASLIANGEKWIENRTWPTGYRGPLAIHAGKGLQYLSKVELSYYPSGAIIATADLVACVKFDEIIKKSKTIESERNQIIPGTCRAWLRAAEHKHAKGPWCWILENVQKFNPVKMSGSQGLWIVPSGIVDAIRESKELAAF
jgi:hypothetical protein